MTTPTQQRLTKRRLALIQLERAVKLLEDDVDPVCALTLAAAAEEILGQIAKHKSGRNALEDSADYLATVYDWAKVPRPSRKTLFHRHNRLRNELKHNDKGKNSWVQADYQFEAEEFLLRAVRNYCFAFNCLPASKRIRRWFEWMCL